MADPTTESQAVTATTASDAASSAHAPESQAATPATQPAEGSTLLSDAAAPAEGEAPNESDAPQQGDTPAESAPPAEYEFKVPDGVTLSGEVFDELKAYAKEKGLSQDDAQKLVDLGVKQAQSFNVKLAEQVQVQAEKWRVEALNDPELGNGNKDTLGENANIAKLALKKFGSPELQSLLDQSGLGNNPEVLKFMYRVGKPLSEDTKLHQGRAPQQDRSNIPIANLLYPNQK